MEKECNIEFQTVDIEEFYDKDELNKDEFSTNLVVLTEKEQILVNTLFDRLKSISPESLEVFANRVADLERLTKNIAHFPSLLERQVVAAEIRTEQTLIESLLANRGGDKMLHLPSKAILGKGFIVAKFHVFMSMCKIALECGFPKNEVAEYQKATLSLMFTIMAEDVYLSMLDNVSIPIDLKNCPDLGPVLCTLAMFADGITHITNASRLRLKESDRIEAMVCECKKMGCEIEVINDELIIHGGFIKPNIDLDGWKDHRIVMACAIALTKLGGTIHGCEAITKSYPSFFEDLKSVGIEVVYD